MKTIKFSEVVRRCGEPSIHLAWVDPARDKTLKRALNEHRVMTLHQELHGGKKDFGSVGFLKDRHAQRLVFPRSLRRFSGRKIIAIDYALMAKEQMGSDGFVPDRLPERTQAPKPVKPAPPSRSKEKIPAPESEIRTGRKLPASKEAKSVPIPGRLGDRKHLLSEVKRAVAELSAGQAVPAYHRLQRLLENQD